MRWLPVPQDSSAQWRARTQQGNLGSNPKEVPFVADTWAMQVQGLQQQVGSLSEELQESTKQVAASQEHAQALEDELQQERRERAACAQKLEGLQADLPPQVGLPAGRFLGPYLQKLGQASCVARCMLWYKGKAQKQGGGEGGHAACTCWLHRLSPILCCNGWHRARDTQPAMVMPAVNQIAQHTARAGNTLSPTTVPPQCQRQDQVPACLTNIYTMLKGVICPKQVAVARSAQARAGAEASELQAQLDLQAVLNGQLVAQVQDHAADLAKVHALLGFPDVPGTCSGRAGEARVPARWLLLCQSLRQPVCMETQARCPEQVLVVWCMFRSALAGALLG